MLNSSLSSRTSRLLASTAIALVLPSLANANPTGGQVAAGSATIARTGSQTLTINQTTQKAVINWQSFSIGEGETTTFNQPGASSITLNRVTGVDPSSILGNLNANGQVWLVNPNGIAFRKSARVDVAGLLATTIDIANADFMSGTYRFSGLRNPSAMVTNAGQIRVRDTGLAALVAPGVENSGLIQANLGQIQLSSAAAFTVDLYGDGLFNFALDKQVTQAIRKPDGSKPSAAVSNSGQLIASGGRILLTANAAKALVDHAINMDGYVQATSASVSAAGEITLDGGSEGTVQVGGTVDASGTQGANGGTIKVLADQKNSSVDVSGSLNAGAASSGNGGRIETSAARVHIASSASVNTSAAGGTTGTWLIDPHDFTVAASGGDITGAALTTQLTSNNVVIQSSTGAGGSNGDINVNDAITWSSHTLTLTAANNVNVNAVMSATGTASLALNPATANGGNAADSTGTILMGFNASGGFSGRVDFGSSGSLSIGGTPYIVITSLGVAGDNSTATLQGMQNNLSGHYALGSDIDASSTAAWNNGAGFSPIANYHNGEVDFAGNFEGLGHTITGLVVNGSQFYGGLFGALNGTIENIGIVNGSIHGTFTAGPLVGVNNGKISNSYASASVGAGGAGGVPNGYVGGLVGLNENGGSIISSHASGDVTAVGDGQAGGLASDNFGSITSSYASGHVTGGAGADVGGLVADNDGEITRSYASGPVTGGGQSGAANVGGLVGTAWFGSTITQSYATGSVTGVGDNASVGGLVGTMSGGSTPITINDCYAVGAVSGSGNSGAVGGLLGTVAVVSVVTAAYWDTETAGQSVGVGTGSSNGVVGLTDASFKKSLPTGFDPSIWAIDGVTNSGYPFLRWQMLVSAPTPSTTALNWSVADASSTYGTLASLGSVTLNGVAAADSGHVSGTVGLFSGSTPVTLSPSLAAGTYAEEVISLSGSAANSYTLATSGNTLGTLTINPATLTYVATATSRVYGTSNPVFTGSVTGFVLGDTEANATTGTLAFTTSATSASSVGSYAINGSGLTAVNGNYVFVQAPGNATALTITPALLTTVTWSVANASSTYGTLAIPGAVTLSGVTTSDQGSVSGKVGLFKSDGTTAVTLSASLAAGKYDEEVIALTGTAASNYTLSPASAQGNTIGTLTINPATLTYVATAIGRTYGDANPTFTGSVTGFVLGQTQASATTGTLSFASSATSASNVGSYDINGFGLTANNGNYVFVQAPGNATALTIRQKTLTWTIADATSVYGAVPSLGNVITLLGVVDSDDVKGVVGLRNDVADFDPSSPNLPQESYTEYVLGLRGNSAKNYALASSGPTATLTVSYSQQEQYGVNQAQGQTAAVGDAGSLAIDLAKELWFGLGDVLGGAAATFSTVAGFIDTVLIGPGQAAGELGTDTINLQRAPSGYFEGWVEIHAPDLSSEPLQKVVDEACSDIQVTTDTIVSPDVVKLALLKYAKENNIKLYSGN